MFPSRTVQTNDFLWLKLVCVGQRAMHAAGVAKSNHAGWDVTNNHTASTDDAAAANGHPRTNGAVGTDPHFIFNDDWRRYTDSLAGTLPSVHGVSSTTDDGAWCNEHCVADVYGRRI